MPSDGAEPISQRMPAGRFSLRRWLHDKSPVPDPVDVDQCAPHTNYLRDCECLGSLFSGEPSGGEGHTCRLFCHKWLFMLSERMAATVVHARLRQRDRRAMRSCLRAESSPGKSAETPRCTIRPAPGTVLSISANRDHLMPPSNDADYSQLRCVPLKRRPPVPGHGVSAAPRTWRRGLERHRSDRTWP